MINFSNRHGERVEFNEDTPGLKAYIHELLCKGTMSKPFRVGETWVGTLVDNVGDVTVSDRRGSETWLSVHELVNLAGKLHGEASHPIRQHGSMVRVGDNLFNDEGFYISRGELPGLVELFND